MFHDCLTQIDANATRELAALGVPGARVSDWRAGRRLPTRPQALALAHVMRLDFDELERELTALEAAKDAEKNNGVAKLLKTARVRSILIMRSLADSLSGLASPRARGA